MTVRVKLAPEIEIKKDVDGMYLRPISAAAKEWVMKELRIEPWQFRDGWCCVLQHQQRVLDGIQAQGFVRRFVAVFQYYEIGAAGSSI